MKKGFTLVELMAVIIILGIIALILVPKIGDIIEDSTIGSDEKAATMYVKNIENELAAKKANKENVNYNGSYTLNQVKRIIKPDSRITDASIEFEDNEIVSAVFCVEDRVIIYDGNNSKYNKDRLCSSINSPD